MAVMTYLVQIIYTLRESGAHEKSTEEVKEAQIFTTKIQLSCKIKSGKQYSLVKSY